ncbi:MAG: SpoIIE family protein phosphatase [Anaerolineales bacterium]|nr:SpoIIE family protein phosphatase [Anaerolineales bacterium]MCB8952011.1 SpoIIE family protein phosphatase [Ardenticatenales bacterium]
MLFSIEAQTGGLTWPSISFALLLGSLVASAIVLYWRYRSRQQLMQRVSQLEALREASSAIVAAELDVEALCELIYHEAGKVIENRTFQVGLFQDNQYAIKIWYIEGQKQIPRTFDLGSNGGLVGWVRQAREPLLISDFAKEMDELPARPLYVSDHPPRSALFIPMISGETVIGVLASQSSAPNRYHQSDLQRLGIIANQAASAIANADLYQRERTRAAQLELVGQIARQVNAVQDLDEIFQRVVLLTHRQFGFHPVNIFGLNGSTGEIVIEASSANSLVSGDICLREGEGLIGSAIQMRRTINARDVQEDGRYIAQLGLPDIDPIAAYTHSEIVIPLIVDKEVLGVLDVHSPTLNAFSGQEQTVLEALAAQVAIAIHKARQFNRQREQAWLTTAQLQMAEAISRSEDLDDLLDSITRLTTLLVGVDMCAILLWDSDDATYTPGRIYADHPEAHTRFAEMRLSVGDWPPLDAVHVGMESLTTEQAPPWQAACAPLTLYPLLAKAEMRGVMIVKPPPGRSAAQELLQNFSNQVAQAIDNAQLSIAQQEEAWVNTALLQVAEAVNSLIDLQDILSTIVRFVPMLIGVESCIVLVWDEEKSAFHAGPSHGLSDMARGLLETFEIPSKEIAPLEAKESGLFGPSATYYTLSLPPWLQTALKSSTAAAFPLHARNRLVGALVVGPPLNGYISGHRALSGRRLSILAGIAHQASIAVVNDQLYREAAERDKLAQELRVAHAIQASLIPPGSPEIPGCQIASYWQAARDVSGDFYDFMRLNNGRWGIVVADVADKGMPAALFMAVSRTILRAVSHNRVSPAETLERVNELLFNDTQTDLFVTVFYAVWDPPTETLTYANAGHNPPLWLRKDGREMLLSPTGMALGVLEEVKIKEKQTRLSPGDVVVFYTDGVTEAMNEDYDEYGTERLCLAVKGARERDAAGIIEAITQGITDHAGGTPQFDDVTMVVMKRT